MPENGNECDLQRRSIEKMKQDVGVWNCKWEFLDEQGNVASTACGTQTMKFVIDDCVMQILMDVPEMETQSVTHRFYHPILQRLFWISVDNHGDHWSFVEELDGDYSKSLPHMNPDGSCSYLRFKPLRETLNNVDVLMESSNDDENWNPVFRQYRVRQ